MEGQTATNPQTGEKIVYRGGQWQPLNAPAAPQAPGVIMGRPKAPTELQLAAERRAQADQARQEAQFQTSQQKAALDIQKSQRDLAPGADTTESEKTAGFLATRVAGGLKELQRITSQNKDAAKPTFGVEAVRSIFGDTAANYLTDADRQQVVAAQRDILDAALTLGTGAAYTAEQLEGYRQAYFPQLGDDDATIKGKQQRLQQLLESAKVKAGRSAPLIDQALTAAGIGAVRDVSALQQAFDSGASLEEIMQLAQQTGTPTPVLEDLIAAIRFRDQGGAGARILPPDNSPPDNNGGGLGGALYAGVGDVAEFAGDTLGLIGNPLNAGINAIAGTNLSTDLGQTFRDATGAPDGNPLATAITKGGLSALTGAGVAGAVRPLTTGVGRSVANTLAQEPIRQGLAGAGAGASAELARQQGANPLVQAAAGLAGGVATYGGAGGVNALMRAAQPGPTAPIVAEAARARIPLMTTDAIPPRTAPGKAARKLGEMIPLAGTSGPRVAQQEARIDAVKALARDYEVDEASLADVAKDLAKTRGNQIKTFKAQKDRILENVTAPAQAPRAIAALDQQIAAASKVQTASSQALVSKLQDFKTALQNGGNTIKELEAIRKEMGAAFKDPSLASIADAGTKAVRAIYSPLRDDMAATIRQAAGDEAARTWRVANARLASMADELQSTALKSTLNKAASTPEDVAKLLFSAKPSQVRLLYNNLSSEGRAKAQSVLIGRALEKAGDDISPDKFANELDRLAKNVGIFFQDSDLARVQGLARVLQATKRASQAGVQPDNGAQIVPYAIPTALTALFGVKGGIGAAGTFGIGARIYESAPVRNALLKLGRTKPGSPQEQGAMARALTAIAAANDNPEIAAFAQTAPGSARAAASEGQEEREERPIKP